jgi:hypothetical protein
MLRVDSFLFSFSSSERGYHDKNSIEPSLVAQGRRACLAIGYDQTTIHYMMFPPNAAAAGEAGPSTRTHSCLWRPSQNVGLLDAVA